MHPSPDDEKILAITRPHSDLLTYYVLASFAIPPLFPVLLVYHIVRYRTMRYRFTDEGISMSWGILFRREIIIQYARIQDIHLRSNVVERWLGLAKVLVQTASGNAGAEMTLEGLKEFEAVRDFLYHRMRGVREPAGAASAVTSAGERALAAGESAALAAILTEVVTELRALRTELAQQRRPEA